VRISLRISVLLVAFAACAVPLRAQSTTGTISGGVVDESKAVIPGATVEVRNVDTGIARSQTTGPDGRYRALSLPPGRYSVTVSLEGFSKAVVDNLVLEIGRDLPVDVMLKVGRSESVEVTAEKTTLDLSTAVVGGVVTTRQISELPLNGRSFMQLATLQPGVLINRNNEKDFSGGFSNTQISIAGARPENTGYLLDGTNIADPSDKAPASMAGVLLGVDTVQEFSVQTHGYSAEFGRAAGGIISAVTKSGTNQFRGSAFEFHRDSGLDAPNFFDEGDPPPFVRNQFGATLGGPIVKNRMFFFASYEGLRDRLSTTRLARVPNARAHQGFLPAAGGGETFVGVQPTVQPYLDRLYPLPNGQDFGDGTGELRLVSREPTDQDYFVGKVDWQLSNNDSLLVRLSSDRSDSAAYVNPSSKDLLKTDNRFFTTQWQHLFSSSLVNVARGALNRTFRDQDPQLQVDMPRSLWFVNEPLFGILTITGLTGSGNTDDPTRYTQNLYQLADTLTWNRGRHTWRFGFDAQRYHFDGFSYSRRAGDFRFRSLREFMTLSRSATAQADRFLGNLPGTDTVRHMRQNYFAFFTHDDFRVSNKLSLSYGLRYEFVTTPHDTQGKVAGLLSLNDLESGPLGVTPGSPMFDNPSKKSFAPRVGVAWNPFGPSTTIKAGGGVFYQPLTTSFYRGTTFRVYPYFAGVDIRQPVVFGPGIQGILAAASPAQVQKRSEFIDFDTNQPYNIQWYLNSEHEFSTGTIVEVGYMGSRGDNLPYYADPNAVPSETVDGRKRIVPGATIRFPSWGRIRTRRTIAESTYNGLILGVRQRLKAGLQFQASYTLSKSEDDWSGGLQGSSDFGIGSGTAVDYFDPAYEHGPSAFDVRHSFVFNAVYQLPWGKDLKGLGGVLAKGWQVNTIVTMASGMPFNPVIGFDRAGDRQSDTDMQRPDFAPGRDAGNAIVGGPNNWFDAAAFVLPPVGFFGNVGRNSLRGPNLRLVDLSLVKNQSLGLGRTVAQFRVEVFNLFNRANFGLPTTNGIFLSDGSRVPNASQITETATTARQVQLGVKILF